MWNVAALLSILMPSRYCASPIIMNCGLLRMSASCAVAFAARSLASASEPVSTLRSDATPDAKSTEPKMSFIDAADDRRGSFLNESRVDCGTMPAPHSASEVLARLSSAASSVLALALSPLPAARSTTFLTHSLPPTTAVLASRKVAHASAFWLSV